MSLISFIICIGIFLLYIIRFTVTSISVKNKAYPARIADFSSVLQESQDLEDREDFLSFGESAAREKNLIMDNMTALVNFRRFSTGPETADISQESKERTEEYAAMLQDLDRELEIAVSQGVDWKTPEVEEEKGLTVLVDRLTHPDRFRYLHFASMAALSLLLIAQLATG